MFYHNHTITKYDFILFRQRRTFCYPYCLFQFKFNFYVYTGNNIRICLPQKIVFYKHSIAKIFMLFSVNQLEKLLVCLNRTGRFPYQYSPAPILYEDKISPFQEHIITVQIPFYRFYFICLIAKIINFNQ